VLFIELVYCPAQVERAEISQQVHRSRRELRGLDWVGLLLGQGCPAPVFGAGRCERSHEVDKWVTDTVCCRGRNNSCNSLYWFCDSPQEIPSLAELTPEALGAHHKAEIEKWWPIIKSANIKAD
jgi:hypothetical protein